MGVKTSSSKSMELQVSNAVSQNILRKVMIYVKCASKEIPKQFSRSKILNMVWNPYISAET